MRFRALWECDNRKALVYVVLAIYWISFRARGIEWHKIRPFCSFQIIWSCVVEHEPPTVSTLAGAKRPAKMLQAAAVLRCSPCLLLTL